MMAPGVALRAGVAYTRSNIAPLQARHHVFLVQATKLDEVGALRGRESNQRSKSVAVACWRIVAPCQTIERDHPRRTAGADMKNGVVARLSASG